MKKKILIASTLFLYILFGYSAYAQDKYDAVYDKIAKETCECMENDKELHQYIENKNLQKINEKLGLCLLSVSEKNRKLLPKKQQNVTSVISELGEEIGARCVKYCPNLMAKIVELNRGSEETQNSANTLSAEVESVTPISAEYMLVFHVKEIDGTAHTLLWENKPEGPDELINRPETLKGKTMQFDYVLQDVYSSKTQSYVKVKKIIGIEVK